MFLRADRLAYLKIQADQNASEDLWWNRLKNMSEQEIDLLPFGFLKKYGTFIMAFEDYKREVKTDESMAREGRYAQIENLDRLLTNAEK